MFGASVHVRNNTAEAQISRNVIRGDLVCVGNDPTPTGTDNRIRGRARGQCRDLTGVAATIESNPAVVGEQAADRHVAALERLRARSIAASEGARQAGPARIGG